MLISEVERLQSSDDPVRVQWWDHGWKSGTVKGFRKSGNGKPVADITIGDKTITKGIGRISVVVLDNC